MEKDSKGNAEGQRAVGREKRSARAGRAHGPVGQDRELRTGRLTQDAFRTWFIRLVRPAERDAPHGPGGRQVVPVPRGASGG